MSPAPSDLELLRRYEPVVRFTAGELFLPMRVEDYLRGSALYAGGRGGSRPVAERGTLDPESLARLGREHGDGLYLRFVDEPLSRREYRAWRADPARPRFAAGSRFASVGLASRLVDTTMRLTLLARGKVPGGFAAAAHRRMDGQEECAYYGHVTRDAGYVVCQYWYLYAMNDWRSTFGGVNDHEADWEQVTVFLADRGPGADPEPAWVAFSSHDEVGDDLRRRWDDPDIAFVDGTHPVVYAGAGSHSGAYLPGDYAVAVPLPLPPWVDRVRRGLLRVLPWSAPEGPMGIPYLDYRRGDGPGVGPGETRGWTAVPVGEGTGWVVDFRGLWGLDTRDPFGGERAPAGPRYERGGAVRDSWRQPVAWAGLDKEAPTAAEAAAELRALRATLAERRAEGAAELDAARTLLRGARRADRGDGLGPRRATGRVRDLAGEVARLRARDARAADDLDRVDRALARPPAPEPVHAHLHHRAVPLQDADRHGLRARLLRVWAAASASVLLGAAGVLLLVGAPHLVTALLVLVGAMVVVEAVLRGRLLRLAVNVAAAALVGVAGYALAALVLGNVREGAGVLLLLAALYMAWHTLEEGLRT